eukprot:gene198-96_t
MVCSAAIPAATPSSLQMAEEASALSSLAGAGQADVESSARANLKRNLAVQKVTVGDAAMEKGSPRQCLAYSIRRSQQGSKFPRGKCLAVSILAQDEKCVSLAVHAYLCSRLGLPPSRNPVLQPDAYQLPLWSGIIGDLFAVATEQRGSEGREWYDAVSAAWGFHVHSGFLSASRPTEAARGLFLPWQLVAGLLFWCMCFLLCLVEMNVGKSELANALHRLEGKSYPAYKDLIGDWDMPEGITISIDRCQSDPYAPPSSMRVAIPWKAAGFPDELKILADPVRNVAACDYLTRKFAGMLIDRGMTEAAGISSTGGKGGWGGSKGGDIQIIIPSQFILPRTSVSMTKSRGVEARITLSLPAKGRTIEGYRAASIVCSKLVKVCQGALYFSALNGIKMKEHLECAEDQEALRQALSKKELVAFVGNGSVLPRRSGVDDKPLQDKPGMPVVAFHSPDTTSVDIVLPNRGKITGMGIKKGVTLIVGGGFHGKSTLLSALQVGIYNKVPGDGREFVVTDPTAVKIRAEDGRFIKNVDISPFINNLPFGQDTTHFSTEDASGSTSQAANIMEALELGSSTLLRLEHQSYELGVAGSNPVWSIFANVDEDTCATNFMIRDERMAMLVAKDKEPIKPFIYKVRPLFENLGVSSILVVGGCGDFFTVADSVIMMHKYQAVDVTDEAQIIVQATGGTNELVDHYAGLGFDHVRSRVPTDGLWTDGKVFAKNLRSIDFGGTEIELTNVEQLVEVSQAKAILDSIKMLSNDVDGHTTLAQLMEDYEKKVHANNYSGLDKVYGGKPIGYHAYVRKFELASAINRLRRLKTKGKDAMQDHL